MTHDIVFSATTINTAGREVHDIYAMRSDGTNLRRITTNPPDQEWDCYGPVWSPDGTTIAFAGFRERPAVNDPSVYLMDADGGNVRQITHGCAAEGCCWSPDGTRLAIARDGCISVLDLAGNVVCVLTQGGLDYDPAWSPDGTRIAFVRDGGRSRRTGTRVFVIDADGSPGDERLLVPGDGPRDGSPAWSRPDGGSILFERVSVAPERVDLYEMEIGSGLVTRRTTIGAYNGQPCCSPTGDCLVFSSDAEGPFRLFIADRDGSNPRRIENAPDAAYDPDLR